MSLKIINYLMFLLKKYFVTINKIKNNKGKILILTENINLLQLLKLLQLKNFYINKYSPGIFTNNTYKPDIIIILDKYTHTFITEKQHLLIPIILLKLPRHLTILSKKQKEKFFFQFFYMLSYKLTKIANAH